MKMSPVKSGAIAAVGHDPISQRLRIEFTSGKTYEYHGVSAEQHQALVNADSIGAHFGKHLRGKHKFTEL